MVNCISQDYKDILKSMLDQHVGDAIIAAFLSVVPSCEKVAGMQAAASETKTPSAETKKLKTKTRATSEDDENDEEEDEGTPILPYSKEELVDRWFSWTVNFNIDEEDLRMAEVPVELREQVLAAMRNRKAEIRKRQQELAEKPQYPKPFVKVLNATGGLLRWEDATGEALPRYFWPEEPKLAQVAATPVPPPEKKWIE